MKASRSNWPACAVGPHPHDDGRRVRVEHRGSEEGAVDGAAVVERQDEGVLLAVLA